MIAIGSDRSSIRHQMSPLPLEALNHTKIGMIQCFLQTTNGLFTTGKARSDKIFITSSFLDHRDDLSHSSSAALWSAAENSGGGGWPLGLLLQERAQLVLRNNIEIMPPSSKYYH